MAAASGLPLLKRAERNPLRTSTRGTGQLIRSAVASGAKKIIIGIGGSATVDGGLGMAKELGVVFVDKEGRDIGEGGEALQKLAKIDAAGLDPKVKSTEFLVACDVDNPLIGARGAARIFGPQKGADNAAVELLEEALTNLAKVIGRDLGQDVSALAGAGAAGGLGAGLVAFLGASLRAGIDIIIEAIDLPAKLAGCDLVVTGEGQMDYQTVFGKTPMGAVKAARQHGIPVIALVGAVGKDARKVNDNGIAAFFTSLPRPMSEEEIMAQGASALSDCAEQVGRLIKLSGSSC